MINPDINVERAIGIGKLQLKTFEDALPESFHAPTHSTVVLMSANRKSIDVGGKNVVDTGIFYARALVLTISQRENVPSIKDMLGTELAPTALSLF